MQGTEHLTAVFARHIAGESRDNAAGAIAELIAESRLDRASFDEVVARYDVAGKARFRDALLDLILLAARAALRDHCLTNDEWNAIARLKVIFRVEEGDFYRKKRQEIADILSGEIQRILDDLRVDTPEALYQVELQRLFDLGYDQYLELTRDPFLRIIDSIIGRLERADEAVDEPRREFFRALARLDTALWHVPQPAATVATTRHRSLGYMDIRVGSGTLADIPGRAEQL